MLCCSVRATCSGAGKRCANLPLPPSPPGPVPSRVPPSALPQTTLGSFQQRPGSSVYLHCQPGIPRAPPYLPGLAVPFVLASCWRWLGRRAASPLPPSPGCRGFPSPLPVSCCFPALCVRSAPDAHHVVVAFESL